MVSKIIFAQLKKNKKTIKALYVKQSTEQKSLKHLWAIW